MVRLERVRTNDGAGNAVLDLQVSTVSELPALGDKFGIKLIVMAGSIAQVIQTGKWYTLDENGTWYDSDGAAANATNNTRSLATPVTADEPEQTETDELNTDSEVTEDER